MVLYGSRKMIWVATLLDAKNTLLNTRLVFRKNKGLTGNARVQGLIRLSG